MLDPSGNVKSLSSKPLEIKIRKGEMAQVEAVLEHVPRLAIAAGVVTVAVAAVLLHDWLKDHDLPVPPLPPPWLWTSLRA